MKTIQQTRIFSDYNKERLEKEVNLFLQDLRVEDVIKVSHSTHCTSQNELFDCYVDYKKEIEG